MSGENTSGEAQGDLLNKQSSPDEIRFVSEGFDGSKLDDSYRTENGFINATKMAEDLHALKNAPAPSAPESYTIPEELADAKDDPSLVAFGGVAKEAGLSQEVYAKLVSGYSAAMARQEEAAAESAMADLKKAMPNADEVIEKNKTFWQGQLSEDSFKALAASVTDIGALKAVNEIRELLVSKGKVAAAGAEGTSVTLTEAELRTKMASDAYWNPRHPEYRALRNEVTSGYGKLYGGAQ